MSSRYSEPSSRSDKARMWWRIGAVVASMIIVAVVSFLLIDNTPTGDLNKASTLEDIIKHIAETNAVILGLGGAILGLISAVITYVFGSGPTRDYIAGFLAFTAAFAGLVAAYILFVPLTELASR